MTFASIAMSRKVGGAVCAATARREVDKRETKATAGSIRAMRIAQMLPAVAFVSLLSTSRLAVAAQTAPPTFRDMAMLAKVMLKYRGLKSLSQSVHGKMTINADGVILTADLSTTVRLAQPDRFLLDSTVTFGGSAK